MNRGEAAYAPVRSYASVLAGLAGLTALCLHWRALWGERVPWLVFVLAILASAVFGGAGPALLATVLSAFAVGYFFIGPLDSWVVAHPLDQAHVLMLIAAGVAMSALAGRMQRVRDHLWTLSEQRRRRAEEAEAGRWRMERRFQTVFASHMVPLMIGRLDGRVLEANEAWLELTGGSREALDGDRLRWDGLLPGEAQLAEMRAGKRLGPTEIDYARPDGGHVPVLVGVAPMPGEADEMLVFAVDMRERRRAEAAAARELLLDSERAARAEAERANRLKDEFVATLSHELRTPLNAILGWTDLARRPGSGPEQLERALSIVARNGHLLAQLIADLLDVSRAITGKLHLEQAPLDVPGAVDAALETLRGAAEAKEIAVEVRLDRRAPPVLGDVGRVKQIAINLLSNAIKFTPRGGRVEVAVAARGASVHLVVSDTGEGIDPAFLPHIFERFRQAEGSASRRHGGLGLGLSIVKHLVDAHGGKVGVESAGVGRGSCFTVELPAAPEVSAGVARPGHARRSEALAGARILVVDDEPDAQELVRRFLEDEGASIVTAGSAVEALAVLAAERVDALVSDIGMPGMDGYEMMRRVRAGACRVPAVALTAYARPEDRERALDAGFHAHVCKPVELSEVAAALAAVLKPAA